MTTDAARAQVGTQTQEAEDGRGGDLHTQVARLAALVEQQQRQIEAQRIIADQQQEEIAELRGQRPFAVSETQSTVKGTARRRRAQRTMSAARHGGPMHEHASASLEQAACEAASAASSRRALLKWGGVAAAAATVALVASEQSVAHAEGQNALSNGANIQAGMTTTAESQTVLSYDGSAGGANPIFLVNDSTLTSSVVATYNGAALGAWVGNGTTTGGVSGNLSAIIGYTEAFTGSGDSEVDGIGVVGVANNNFGTGVYGHASETGGAGVGGHGYIGTYGFCPSSAGAGGIGVEGLCIGSAQTGVYGYAPLGGYGVVGYSSTGIDLALQGTGRLQQLVQGSPGAPTSGSYSIGEQVRDNNGELWLCLVSGTPGTWVRALHVLPGLMGGAISFLSQPTRLLDTRGQSPNAYINSGGPQTGGPFTYQVAGITNPHDGVSIPSSATGAIGKVTVLAASGSGYVAIVPSGSGTPNTGTIPYGNGASLVAATSFTVGLGGSPGSIDIYIPGSPANLVIDIFGVIA